MKTYVNEEKCCLPGAGDTAYPVQGTPACPAYPAQGTPYERKDYK